MEKNSTKYQNSPYINQIIEKKPNWLIRYGVGAMLLFLLLFLAAAWLVKYPDTIVGQVNITTPRPPADVVAKISAPVERKFPLKEGDTLYKRMPILLMESTTSYLQIEQLYNDLSQTMPNEPLTLTNIWLDSLGSLQSVYNVYALAKLNLDYHYNNRPYNQRIESLEKIIDGNSNGLKYSNNYLKSSKKDYQLKQKERDRYETLFKKGVISASEFEQIEQTLLQKEMGYANDHKNLNSERISIANLKREIMELGLQKTEREQQLRSTYLTSLNELKSQVKQWESQYLITSPITGKLYFFDEINEGEFITAGEKVLTVIPFQEQKLQAVGMFPVANAGKVKKGNKVVLKLDAYPYHEFGTVEGKVTRISEIPVENLYSIVIDLPNGLSTNYKNKITFKQRLTATADIVTKDQSVLGRIFYQFENLFKN